MVGTDLMNQALSELWAEAVARDLLFSGAIQQGASSGNLSQLQIKNPAASGKQLYVVNLRLNSGGATFARMGRSDAVLGTDITTFGTMALGSGKASVADLNRGVVASASGLFAISGYIREVDVDPAADTEAIHPRFPFRLPPGVGLVVEATVANLALGASILWVELDA